MSQFRNLERPWLVSAMLALAVLAAYLPVGCLDFINFDDTLYVTLNRNINAGLKWAGVQWAFSHFCAGNWHPLTWLSHMLDCQLYGLRPLGHHLTNVLFHTANTVILFLWLRSLTGAVWRSALVAALFGLHPSRVESVAWVSERKDVLCAFFGILSLWAYTRYVRARGNRSEQGNAIGRNDSPPGSQPADSLKPGALAYGLSLFLFALGLLSKPMLVTWPFLMLLLDYWPLGRFKSVLGLIAEKIPFFVLSAGSCILTFFAQREGGAVATLQGTHAISVASRFSNVPISYARYLWMLVWPRDLAIIYPFVRDWPEELVLASALLLLAVTALVLWRARRNPYLLFGWFWYLGAAVPVIGIIQVGTQSIADRYTYMPAIGLFIILAWGLRDLVARWRPCATFMPATAVAGLLTYAWLDGRQLLYWQNSETLFRHALAVTKQNYMAHSLLGSYFSELGDLEPAKAQYYAALQVAPDIPNALNNLGCALVAQKRYEDGAEIIRKALELKPRSVDAHCNLGSALFGLGRGDQAIAQYREAVRIEPDNVLAQYDLGNVLCQKSQMAEGIEHLRIAIKLNPQYAEAHIFLAEALMREGKPDEAAAQFQHALILAPGSLHALYAYASFMAGQGKWDEAAKQYSAILRLLSNDKQARLNLGIAQAAQGKMGDAIDSLSAVLRISPNDATANYHLAAALAAGRQFKDAIRHYRQALNMQPDFSEALNNLAWILAANPDAQLRNGPEAVTLAERACKQTDYQQPILIGTLAAAYAEAGRFADALTAGEKARALAEANGETELAARNAELLSLYRSGKPFHETP